MMVVLLYFIETYPYIQEILHNADFRVMKHHVSSLFSSGSEKLHTRTHTCRKACGNSLYYSLNFPVNLK